MELVKSIKEKKEKRKQTQKRRLKLLEDETARLQIPSEMLEKYRDLFREIDKVCACVCVCGCFVLVFVCVFMFLCCVCVLFWCFGLALC